LPCRHQPACPRTGCRRAASGRGSVASTVDAADPASGDPFAAFLKALHELGYVDGRNIQLDFRFAENHLDLLPGIEVDDALIIAEQVDV
jgi:hypothetical protein